ncbi:MAG: DUF4364 family protein [Lachnospiraceae bacterium]|nr:DUF4364 family protein [Lachnospiraceae bacterium]
MILFLLSKVSQMYLNNTQLSTFFLENNYATFIEYQEAISDLLETKLVECSKTKTLTRYKLTSEGQSTIEYFENDLSDKVKEDIISYIEKNKIKFKKESSTMADFSETLNGNYKVRLEIEESKESVFGIDMVMPDAELAQKIVERWKNEEKFALHIYEYIINKMY